MKAWYHIGTGKKFMECFSYRREVHPMTAKSDVSEASLRRGDKLNINAFT